MYDNFSLGEEEKKAAIRSLDSGYLSLFEGSHTPDPPFSFDGRYEVQSLESEWSDFYSVKHSISMNPQPLAYLLQLALLTLVLAMR